MAKPTSSLSLFGWGLGSGHWKGLVSQSSSPMDLFGPWWGGKEKKKTGRNVAGRMLREMTYLQAGLVACCSRQLCPGNTGHCRPKPSPRCSLRGKTVATAGFLVFLFSQVPR